MGNIFSFRNWAWLIDELKSIFKSLVLMFKSSGWVYRLSCICLYGEH